MQSQTISFNTQALGTGYSGSNGAGGISFVVVNTNPYPVYLKQINNFQTSASTLTNVTLYHSASSLSGAPGNITTNPAWILDLTVPSVTIAAAASQNPILTNLNIAIPANDTFRFHLGSTSTISYTTSGAAVTPNNFTNLGVKLLVGDFQIGAANVGYGGPATAPTNQPRSFTGTVVIDATPATPCTGIPTAGSTSANDTNVCIGQTVVFNLSGLVGASGQSFQWQENGINLLNDTNSFLLKTITAGNAYQCVVTCNNTSQSTTSAPLTMVLNPFSSCYCSINATGTTGADIGNVTIGAFTNGTAIPIVGNTTANKTYTNFTNLGPVPLFSGAVNSFSIASITSVAAPTTTTITTTRVYVDYDQNGIYDPVNELLFTGTGNFVGNNIITSNPLVPGTALSGITGMRIQVYQSTAFSPCGPTAATLQGETEDYLVNIQPATLCSGAPNIGNVASNDSTVCPSTVFNLSLQNGSIGGGIKYQWQANGVNLANDTLPTLSTSISANTSFTCVTTCTVSSQSSTSSPLLITINPFLVCYCPIVATGTTGADIGNVTVGGFTNGSATPIVGNTTANKTYTDFTNLSPIQIFSGAPNTFSIAAITSVVAPTTTTVITTNVFIDLNQNGIFDPVSELILTGTGNFVGANVATASPIIPISASTGLTRMRVMVYQSTAFGSCGPTSATLQGETEDYIVDIQPSSSCFGTPTAGSVASNDTSVCPSVNFNLSLIGATSGSGIQYQWQANGANLLNDTLPTLTKSILSNTIYTCVLTCVPSGQSATSSPLTITTNPIVSCYCASNSTNPADEDIGQVTLGAVTNGLGCLPSNNNPNANSTGYSDFKTSLAPIPVLKGIATPLSICIINAAVTYFNTSVKVFIDINSDGQFKDSLNSVTPTGEVFLAQLLANNAANRVASTSLIIPATVPNGQIAMRIVANETATMNLVVPCGTYTWGETEDYMLDIQTPVPCAGAPVVGTTAVNDTTVCFGTIVNFTMNGFVPSGGLTYQWQENGVNVPGATNQVFSDTIFAANSYQCVVTCTNTSTSSTSAPITMVLNPFSTCYCPIVATATTGTNIGNVTVGAFTNGLATPILANTNANKAYTSFTNLPPIPVFSGALNNFSISAITSAATSTVTVNGRIYIDFNQNGIFEPATEEVLTGTANYTGSNQINANFLIPGTALSGITGMRVVMYESTAFSPCGPTSNFTAGETEDYLVNIQPSVLCTGAPTGGNVASTDSTVCPTTNFTLSVQGATIGGGITYQWQANGVNLLNDTLPTLTTSITANTIFTCVINCTATGLSASSSPLAITVNPFSVCYCNIIATGTTGADIGNFTLGSFSNGLGTPILANTSANKTYTNFTSLAPIPVFSGTTNPISVGAITSLTTSTAVLTARVYIDYDQNGIYDPVNELFFSGTGNFTGTNVISGSPSLPVMALSGVTGMRVMLYQSTAFTPCGPTSATLQGETEDYLVNIAPAAPCIGVPASIVISSSDLNVCGDIYTLSVDTIVPALGISYTWTANSTPIVAATGPFYSTAQSTTTTYQLTVTCANGGTVSSNSITVNQNPADSCYCFTGLGGFCTSVPIDGFRISKKTGATFTPTTLNNQNNGCTVGIGGQTYTAFPISSGQFAVLAPADTFQLSVTNSIGAPIQVKVWTDWNKDGVWNNTNELTNICTTGCVAGTNSAQFLIDPSAAIGDTVRMRVRTRSGTITDACQSIGSGETEDYFLIVGSNTILSLSQLNSKILTKVSVYPNPTFGILNYDIPAAAKSATIIVTDLLGRKILESDAKNTTKSIDLSGFKNGTYLVVINVDGKIFQSKVLLNQ